MIRNIHAITFDMTDALSLHINLMLDKIELHNDKITTTEVTLKKDGFKYIAELNSHVPHVKNVNLTHESEDMYHAITEVTNKMLLKLGKLKDKHKAKRHQSLKDIDVAAE
jgi:ribosomal subunit interface protein